MIKAVVFDLGGVLIDNPQPKMFAFYAKTLGVTDVEFESVFKKYENLWQKGEIEEKDLWSSLSKDLNLSNVVLEDKSYWLEGFKEAYREHQDVLSLAKTLKNNKCKIVLLSNTEIPVINFIEAENSYKFFDYFIYSCKIGMVKPDLDVFQSMLKTISEKAEEVVFIDDKKENVKAAKDLGINGIVFNDYESLKKELESLKTI